MVRRITTWLHLAMSSLDSTLCGLPYLQREYTLAHSQLGKDCTPPRSVLDPCLAEECQDLLADSVPHNHSEAVSLVVQEKTYGARPGEEG